MKTNQSVKKVDVEFIPDPDRNREGVILRSKTNKTIRPVKIKK